jgi:GDPmannose 4,6-dehydratase
MSVVGISRQGVNGTAATELTDPRAVQDVVEAVQPAEIYYLAAVHGSSEQSSRTGEADLLAASFGVHVQGLVHFLEAIRICAPHARLLYAASAHVFGANPASSPQDESTPFRPDSPYAITKAAGVEYCRYFRRRHGVFCSSAILYNHESPLRGPGFVSQRIVNGVADVASGRAAHLTVGSLSAVVDWGWAPDFVDAMRRIVRHGEPDDFVVATGEPHTVGDFVAAAFRLAGIENWSSLVRENPGLLQTRRGSLIGNPARLHAATGWKPSKTFDEMVEALWIAAQKSRDR